MGIFDKIKDGSLDIQGAFQKAQDKITETQQQFVGKKQNDSGVSNSYISSSPVPQNTSGQVAQIAFCSNCGTKLNDCAKFCHGCGASVGTIQTPPPIPQNDIPERKQEYAGTIMKCPNCGCVINETTAICPDCGLRLTGKSAVSSVQEFKDQLMAIENSRKKGLGGVLGVYLAADKADAKILALVKNFPIPNTIDDCIEFMMLAIANIDVSLSKNTLANKMNSTNQVETAATIKRSISNAWVAKMEQVYKKAEIVFPNDPAFAGIQKLYFDKMKELKIKIR